jgi:hypothetical protein
MQNTEIEQMLTGLKVKVDVQNFHDLLDLMKNSTWEYYSVRLHIDAEMGEDYAAMNAKGKEGWELVAIVPNVFPDPGKSYEAFFKRRIK